jgi:hypothetical protein
MKYSEARDDKVRFGKMRQENEMRRGKLEKANLGNVTGEIGFN